MAPGNQNRHCDLQRNYISTFYLLVLLHSETGCGMLNINRDQYVVLPMRDDDEEGAPVEKTVEEPVKTTASALARPAYNACHLAVAFVIGGLVFGLIQHFILSLCSSSPSPIISNDIPGSTEVHGYPPTPTTRYPELFPTGVGYAGATPTGTEAALAVTAPEYPVHTEVPHLVKPAWSAVKPPQSTSFDIFRKWGNLSPWYSNERNAFNLDSSPEPPESCQIIGLHLLHRHGARYPTAYGLLPSHAH